MPDPPPDVPRGYVRARVARRRDCTPDLAVFHLEPEAPLAFSPGQYVTLALPDENGRLVKRPYSIVSAPHEPQIELYVERVEGGALTPALWDYHEGDHLLARERIVGQFLLEEGSTCHVFCATVTGIAPFCSMLRDHRHRMERGAAPDHRFLILLAASTPDDFGPYADEMRAFGREEWAETVVTISRPWEAPGWTDETGRVEDVLRKHLGDTDFCGPNATVYACGNPDMIANVRGVLRRAGFSSEQIREEEYFHAHEQPPETADPVAPAKPSRGALPGTITLKTAPPPE
jgi:ferredoxin--NADP+ reductase